MEPEIIQFTYTEKDRKEIHRNASSTNSFYTYIVLLLANLSVFFAAILKAYVFSAFFAGVGGCFFILGLISNIFSKKNLKKDIEETTKCVNQFQIFENYFTLEVYRQKELLRYYKVHFFDIEYIHDLGDYYSIAAFSLSFIIPKKELEKTSVLIKYIENNPQKSAVQKKSNLIFFLNYIHTHLLIPAILAFFTTNPNWIIASQWLVICATPLALISLLFVLFRYRSRQHFLGSAIRLLICILMLPFFFNI